MGFNSAFKGLKKPSKLTESVSYQVNYDYCVVQFWTVASTKNYEFSLPWRLIFRCWWRASETWVSGAEVLLDAKLYVMFVADHNWRHSTEMFLNSIFLLKRHHLVQPRQTASCSVHINCYRQFRFKSWYGPAIQVQTLNGLMEINSLSVKDLTWQHSRKCEGRYGTE
jgi:hypothetical protein